MEITVFFLIVGVMKKRDGLDMKNVHQKTKDLKYCSYFDDCSYNDNGK